MDFTIVLYVGIDVINTTLRSGDRIGLRFQDGF